MSELAKEVTAQNSPTLSNRMCLHIAVSLQQHCNNTVATKIKHLRKVWPSECFGYHDSNLYDRLVME